MNLKISDNRHIKVQAYGKIVRLDFGSIFQGSYGASDFIAICSNYEVILLEHLTKINLADSNLARRFILFVILSSNG